MVKSQISSPNRPKFSMKVITCDIIGTKGPPKHRILSSLIKRERPIVLMLQETKCIDEAIMQHSVPIKPSNEETTMATQKPMPPIVLPTFQLSTVLWPSHTLPSLKFQYPTIHFIGHSIQNSKIIKLLSYLTQSIGIRT